MFLYLLLPSAEEQCYELWKMEMDGEPEPLVLRNESRHQQPVELDHFVNLWNQGSRGMPRDIDTLVIRLEHPVSQHLQGDRIEWDFYLLRNALEALHSVSQIQLICCGVDECEFENGVVEKYVALPMQLRHKANLATFERVLENSEKLRTTITHIQMDPICCKLHFVECCRLFYLINPEQITFQLAHLAVLDGIGMLRFMTFLKSGTKYNKYLTTSRFQCKTFRLTVVATTSYQLNTATTDLRMAYRETKSPLMEFCVRQKEIPEFDNVDHLRQEENICLLIDEFLHFYDKTLLLYDLELTPASFKMCAEIITKKVFALVYANTRPYFYLDMDMTRSHLLQATMNGFVGRFTNPDTNHLADDDDDGTLTVKKADQVPLPVEMVSTNGGSGWTNETTDSFAANSIYWRTFGIFSEKKEDRMHCGVLICLDNDEGDIRAFIPVGDTPDAGSMPRWRTLLHTINTENARRGGDMTLHIEYHALSLLFLALRWNPLAFLEKHMQTVLVDSKPQAKKRKRQI
jgi:hypothetical protein